MYGPPFFSSTATVPHYTMSMVAISDRSVAAGADAAANEAAAAEREARSGLGLNIARQRGDKMLASSQLGTA